MAVVKTPESVPAAKSCGYLRNRKKAVDTCGKKKKERKETSVSSRAVTYVRTSSGLFCCSFLPSPNPKKQTANMGVTPMMGAAMPL